MTHHLYLEIEGIQRFVFAGTKLKIIRGGSALLDLFNRDQMRRAVEEKGGEVIFAGGGHCLAGGLSRDAALVIARKLERDLRKLTDGQVSLAWGVGPETETGDWKSAWAEVSRDMHRRALAAPAASPPLPPFVALCSSCGVSPARTLRDMRERALKPLCQACLGRIEMAEKVLRLEPQTIWHRLRPLLNRQEDDVAFRRLLPERELEQLASLGSVPKYLGYLYCDGNGMGRWLAQSATAKEYGDRSRRVDAALHKAVASAMDAHCPPARSDGKLGAEVLMLGGDDLIVALPADRGAAFTAHVLDTFHKEIGGDVRLSAGLVFAPPTTPITILQKVASELLRSAKRYAYLEETRGSGGRAPGYVDFQELTSSQVEIEREHEVTCRPYRLSDFKTLMERVRQVRKAAVPRARLHALAEALHGSEREAHTTTQLVVSRAKATAGRDQRAALSALLQPLSSADPRESVRPYVTSADVGWGLPFALYPGSGAAAHRWSAVPDAMELIDHLGSDGEDT